MKAETAIEKRVTVAKAEPRVPAWLMPLIKGLILAIDAFLAAFSFLFAFKLREGEAVLSGSAWAWSEAFLPYAGILYFAVPVRLATLLYERSYRYHGAFAYSHEFIKLFKAVAIGSLLIVGWAFLFRGGFAFREFSYSRGVFVLDFVLALAMYSAFHLSLRAVQVAVRNRDVNLIPTLIVGTNNEAVQTIRELNARRALGYRVIGIVRSDRHSAFVDEPEAIAGAAVIGDVDDLADLIKELEIQEVIITDNSIPSERLFEAMMETGRQKVEFRFAPSLFDLLPQKTSVEQIGVLPMVRLFREPLSDAARFLKRASDIIISSVALLFLWPAFAAISVAIKAGSRGPVMFRQERVGMDGRIFLCYKFRTMYQDAGDKLHREAYRQNIVSDENANAGNAGEPVFGKVKDDPRVTRVGKWLRRSSLDELPQLFNVLRGDMSIVGPRPPIPYEVEDYEIWHRKRLNMKPGMTGLWQVSGRNRLPFEEMVRIDLYYIENWSLWLDLKVILLTLPAVLRGDGAR